MKKIYKQNLEGTFKYTGSSLDGLSKLEAEQRLLQNGENVLNEKTKI